MLDHPGGGPSATGDPRGYRTPDFLENNRSPARPPSPPGSMANARYLRNVHRLTLPDYPY